MKDELYYQHELAEAASHRIRLIEQERAELTEDYERRCGTHLLALAGSESLIGSMRVPVSDEDAGPARRERRGPGHPPSCEPELRASTFLPPCSPTV